MRAHDLDAVLPQRGDRGADTVVRKEARAAERELADALGRSRFNALRQCLIELAAPDRTSPGAGTGIDAPRRGRRKAIE